MTAARPSRAFAAAQRARRALSRRLCRLVQACQSTAIAAQLGALFARLEAGDLDHVRAELARLEGGQCEATNAPPRCEVAARCILRAGHRGAHYCAEAVS